MREAATICLRPSTPHAAAQHALRRLRRPACLASSRCVGTMNIHNVRDRQTSDVSQTSDAHHRLMTRALSGRRPNKLSALLTTFKTRPNRQLTNLQCCCCPAWSLLCLFRAPHTHRSAYSLCASGHRRVLEYSLSYSPSTRVTNYSVSAALLLANKRVDESSNQNITYYHTERGYITYIVSDSVDGLAPRHTRSHFVTVCGSLILPLCSISNQQLGNNPFIHSSSIPSRCHHLRKEEKISPFPMQAHTLYTSCLIYLFYWIACSPRRSIWIFG